MTDPPLGEVPSRIVSLEARAQQGTTSARSRMQPYIDAVRRAEQSARGALHERAAAVDESFERLHNELELATHRVAAELATTVEEFSDAAVAGLRRWDVVLDRMQADAAARTPPARERAETVIADLRQRRLAIDEELNALGMTVATGWQETRAGVLRHLDELKRSADASWRARDDT